MSTIVATQRPTPLARPIEGTQGAVPGFFETIGASFRTEEDRQELTQAPRNAEAYQELLDALGELGIDTSSKGALYRDAQSSIPGSLATHRVYDRDAIYAEVLRQRERDPARFTQLPKTREEYDMWIANRKGKRKEDQRTAARGGVAGNLIGGLGSAMTEPYNLATLFAGAGQASLLRTMVIEGVIGAGIEPLNFSSADRAMERMGEDYTVADKALDVLVAGGASAILGGGVRAIELQAPKLGAAAADATDAARSRMEAVIAENWEALPEAVRKRWAKGASIADADLPDLTEALIGRENMSLDERQAVDALRRQTDVAAGSPFKPGMAGDQAHRIKLDDALEALLRPVTRRPQSFSLPQASGAGENLSGSTYLSSSRMDEPRGALKAKIRHVESRGDDGARNPLSTATGRYQFVAGTWLNYYKRRFGSQGLSDEAILAKRTDPVLQERLMDDLTADNAAFLRSIGEAETAGNLYLAHFAGTGGAGKIFRADPDARAADVLGSRVIKANPWMADYSAGDLIGWAHRKMNEPAPRRAGARTELADDYGAESSRLQAELDRIDADEDVDARARQAEDPLGGALADATDLPDGEMIPMGGGNDLPPSPLPDAPMNIGLTDRELTLLPRIREEVDGVAKLSDLTAMAGRLDATEDEVRRMLARLAATEKQLLVQRKDGSFRRAPKDKGPVDAYKYIARAGGMADDEGHDLVRLFGTEAPLRRKGRKGEADGVTMRWQSRLIPGAGPLVRQGGLPIDRVGELLFEGGYLRGEYGDRPTVAETIAYLERGMASKEAQGSLVPEIHMGGTDEWVSPQSLDDMRAHLGEWAYYQDADLNADDIDDLARLMLRNPDLNEDAALAELTNRSIIEALDDMRFESGDYDDAFARYLDATDADDSGARFAPDGRDASEGRAGRAADGDIGEADAIDLAGWDTADQAIIDAETGSVMHDLDALTGDLDAQYFYLDEGGAGRSWEDIKAELEQDAIELQNLKDCL